MLKGTLIIFFLNVVMFVFETHVHYTYFIYEAIKRGTEANTSPLLFYILLLIL